METANSSAVGTGAFRRRPRLKAPQARYHYGDSIDLTLPVGSGGESITTRGLLVLKDRSNRYTGKPEYKLQDPKANRIDYTRWFEEACLQLHDVSLPDAKCKRLSKRGQPCTAPPLKPSGLCIKHRAKLEWDRERQRQKLKEELERRKRPAKQSSRTSTATKPSRKPTWSTIPSSITSVLASPAEIEASADTAMAMWGDVQLFSMSAPESSSTLTPGDDVPLGSRWRMCYVLIAIGLLTVTVSLSIAIWWSLTAHDVSGGFTMAGYIVALGGVVMFPIQSAHSKHCRCWRRPFVSGKAR